MLSVRHRSASGRLDEHWEYLADERRVLVAIRRGNANLVFSVAVCALERPELGAHPIVRLDEESWVILAARFVRCWPNRVETLEAIACPIATSLGPGDQIALTNAPAAVNAALEAL